MEIRKLRETDAPSLRDLRLRALGEHPADFLASLEEEQAVPIERTANRLKDSSEEQFVLGAFREGRLVGMANFSRVRESKACHKAFIEGMYVAPEARGLGIGKALLFQAIEQARALPGVEEVDLWVIAGNEQAQTLYKAAGFQVFCTEPRALRVQGQYYDAIGMFLRLAKA